jgi:hypothetical protein
VVEPTLKLSRFIFNKVEKQFYITIRKLNNEIGKIGWLIEII